MDVWELAAIWQEKLPICLGFFQFVHNARKRDKQLLGALVGTLVAGPSLGLAPKIVADVYRVIAALRDRGIAILLVGQNARAALRVVDYDYVLEPSPPGSPRCRGTMYAHGELSVLTGGSHMDLGVFIPIANNGWLISKTSPQYNTSFALNRDVTLLAEKYGFEFALSMIKLRGFGGESEFWDHALESFTLMAGIAAVTSRIKLYASSAVLTLPPAIAARMASTIDSIAPGRFGINIVSGWAEAEYSQMGLWPGKEHYDRRYEYSAEYVTVMRELWETGTSNHQGRYFQMTDCRLSPRPSVMPKIVSAGQSDVGMAFAAKYADFNFCLGEGVNAPAKCANTVGRLLKAVAKTGRDVGAYVLMMVIADETDAAAQAKWECYKAGKDLDALSWLGAQATADDKADVGGTAQTMINPVSAVNFNMGTLVGSYATVAKMLDELATVEGVAGAMLTFDDFILGMEVFGERILPLMACRK